MNWTVIAAVNNEVVLKSCLLSSPDLRASAQVLTQTGHARLGAAYNQGIDRAASEWLVFAHQDIYFPAGWFAAAERAIATLAHQDPAWGVLGAWGIDASRRSAGYLYCTALGRRLGHPFEGAKEVQSLDEVVLIIRKSSGLRFDQDLPAFHLYGTDICLEAARRDLRSYAIAAFCIHNSNSYKFLPLEYWRCYFYLRRKWREKLPIRNPSVDITASGVPAILWNVRRMVEILRKGYHPGRRVADPAQLYREMALAERDSSSAG